MTKKRLILISVCLLWVMQTFAQTEPKRIISAGSPYSELMPEIIVISATSSSRYLLRLLFQRLFALL